MPKKISPELKERAIRMVQEHRQAYSSVTAGAVAKQPGLGRETVPRWVVDAQGQGAPAGGGQRDPEGGDDFLRGGTRPPQPLIMSFIDVMRIQGHAVESTCRGHLSIMLGG